MTRPDIELHKIPVSEWTLAEAASHLKRTFDAAAIKHPDLMEPYVVMLADAGPLRVMQISIMQEGLRKTFQARHPRNIKQEQVSP